MTTPPDQADTPMRWYVHTAGHRDAHYGALAMNGRIDSPHDASEPCVSCRWCHRASTPAAAVLNPNTATVINPE